MAPRFVNTLSLALESLLILRRCKLSVEMIFRNTVLRSIISGFITGFLFFFTLIFHFHWSNIRQLGPPNWFGIASWSNSGVFTCGTAQNANITVDGGVLIKAATRCDNTLAWTTVANDSSAFSCLQISLILQLSEYKIQMYLTSQLTLTVRFRFSSTKTFIFSQHYSPITRQVCSNLIRFVLILFVHLK